MASHRGESMAAIALEPNLFAGRSQRSSRWNARRAPNDLLERLIRVTPLYHGREKRADPAAAFSACQPPPPMKLFLGG
jgi:hypothetical protein